MKAQPISIYLPDQRDVTIERYGIGNGKLGFGVFTYSRYAGYGGAGGSMGTCPGATIQCESVCYAKRIAGPVQDVYAKNAGNDVPPIPEQAKLLRIHVSGDFDSNHYIGNWITRLEERPDVTAWAFTHSWRVPELVHSLEMLRKLPNLQLFASMDPGVVGDPPAGWRRAWNLGGGKLPYETRLSLERKPIYQGEEDGCEVYKVGPLLTTAPDGVNSYVCPEETGRRKDCLNCGYCFEGKKHDVTFLEH